MSNSDGTARKHVGRLVVISGPSGTGKTSICDALLERLDGSVWSISATTRPMRAGEKSGESYEFIDEAEFQRRVNADLFLEHAEYCGHHYGTPIAPVIEAVRAGRYVIMEIDVQGGGQVAEKMPESLRIFILPPDETQLKQRLERRKTESPKVQAERLAQAKREIEFARTSGAYTHFVINDDLSRAIEEVGRIIHQEPNTG